MSTEQPREMRFSTAKLSEKGMYSNCRCIMFDAIVHSVYKFLLTSGVSESGSKVHRQFRDAHEGALVRSNMQRDTRLI